MALTLTEKLAVTALSKLLYNFLPASGNNSTSFPLAAAEAGVPDSWPVTGGSKGPGIERMLTWMLTTRRERLPRLIEVIVAQSVSYRSRHEPLSRQPTERDDADRRALRAARRLSPAPQPPAHQRRASASHGQTRDQ